MTTTEPRLIVPGDAPRELWHAERGEGVTASRVWAIARGGISTWRREVEQQMNGSMFRGNAATRAGAEREAALLDEAADIDWTIEANAGLWGAAGNDLHRATPDGVGANVVVEVKSHAHGWDDGAIPLEHMGQMQWQIHVLGATHALYGYEVRDEDDQPPLGGATWQIVERDDEMISWLVARADEYIAWREAGCPDYMPMPDELAEANDAWSIAKTALDAAAAAEKTANAALKKIAAAQPHAKRFGLVGMGEHGGFQITVTTKTTIDAAAWAAADPLTATAAANHLAAIKSLEADAVKRYAKTSTTTAMRFQEASNV